MVPWDLPFRELLEVSFPGGENIITLGLLVSEILQDVRQHSPNTFKGNRNQVKSKSIRYRLDVKFSLRLSKMEAPLALEEGAQMVF